MINFGFSYVGLIYLIMLFVPNIIWAKKKPQGYEEYEKHENRILLAFERTGEVLLSVLALIFKDTNVRPGSWWIGWLAASFLAMVLYEFYWLRYFRSKRTMEDMYSSFAGFPVAGATLPVLAFFLLGIYASNIFIIISSLIMAVGHIGIHLQHRKEAGIKSNKSRPVRIAIGMALVVTLIPIVIAVCISVFFIAKRNINYLSCFINPSKGIEEQTYVDINGQKQFISIRGKDKTNPVILFLHGGPLSPDSYVTYTYADSLIDDYTFVCWDQRGCGRTYIANDDKTNSTVSFDQALDDLDVLTGYLCDRFGTDKIIIMGHSYGSLLGARYVYDHPEKVSAYIGIVQFVNDRLSVISEYEDSMLIAGSAGDDTTYMTKAYEAYLEDPNYHTSDEISAYMAQYHPSPDYSGLVMTALESPYLATEDLQWFLAPQTEDEIISLEEGLLEACLTEDLTTQTDYQVPVFFISGADDWTCSYRVMTDYAEQIGADYVLIEGAGHSVQGEKPDEFVSAVKAFLKDI